MDNYKIKVKDEQDFKEVVSLVTTLGYGINFSYSNTSCEVVKGLFLKSNGLVEWTHRDTYFDLNDSKELTLPQLRDLVVLKGKDAELVEQAKRFITPDHLDRFQAAKAHLEGKPVQFMLSNGAFFDITDDSTVAIFANDGGYSFRLKPNTLTVNAELPKPSRELQQNTEVYAVTYEFKTREERNAFAGKLRGTNS